MKTKTWEKYYFFFTVCLVTSVGIYLLFRENGIEMIINGRRRIVEKKWWFLFFSALVTVASLFFWMMGRFFLRSDNFTCKICSKNYSKNMETEEDICQECYSSKQIKY